MTKEKGQGVDSEVMRNSQKMKNAMKQFPRKSKGKFEKTSARSTDRMKYRKDFKKVKKD